MPGLSGMLACSPSARACASNRRHAASANASAAAAKPSSARACTGFGLKPLGNGLRQPVADRADRHDHLAGRGQMARDQRPQQDAAASQQQAFVAQPDDGNPAVEHGRRQQGAAFFDHRLG